MLDATWLPTIDRQTCTDCGDCIATCPVNALGKVGGKVDVVKPETCTYCMVCEDLCPVAAIELPFLICTLETYMKVVGRDRAVEHSKPDVIHPVDAPPVLKLLRKVHW